MSNKKYNFHSTPGERKTNQAKAYDEGPVTEYGVTTEVRGEKGYEYFTNRKEAISFARKNNGIEVVEINEGKKDKVIWKPKVKAKDDDEEQSIKDKIAEVDELIKKAVEDNDEKAYVKLSNERNDHTRALLKLRNAKRKAGDEACAICGGPLGEWGNNGDPVVEGRVCDDCNMNQVIPARLKQIRGEDEADRLYLFPGDLVQHDLESLKDYGLVALGKNFTEDEFNIVVKGKLKDIEAYAHDYLGYELHPDYIYEEDNFAGEIIPMKKSNGWVLVSPTSKTDKVGNNKMTTIGKLLGSGIQGDIHNDVTSDMPIWYDGETELTFQGKKIYRDILDVPAKQTGDQEITVFVSDFKGKLSTDESLELINDLFRHIAGYIPADEWDERFFSGE